MCIKRIHEANELRIQQSNNTVYNHTLCSCVRLSQLLLNSQLRKHCVIEVSVIAVRAAVYYTDLLQKPQLLLYHSYYYYC
jgi:hypothetical protein